MDTLIVILVFKLISFVKISEETRMAGDISQLVIAALNFFITIMVKSFNIIENSYFIVLSLTITRI